MDNNWETVIGLEVHVQLTTKSKLFSGAPNMFGGSPNSLTSLIDLGYPGTLPVVNEEAITMALKLGTALRGVIPKKTIFARKNYFYPDLPKGYQISQFEQPIISGGSLVIETECGDKTIKLVRAHLEEDAGKSIHMAKDELTGVDLNRAGTPLIEVVTEPQMATAKEAVSFMKTLRELVRHLKVCDGNMQEGSFRCDANISVKRKQDSKLGTKVEIKNLNSFKFVENAINYEVVRQITKLENKEKIVQETRLYSEKTGETKTMRTKEDEDDYRYFSDPDLIPIQIDHAKLNEFQHDQFELPKDKRKRYKEKLGLSQSQTDTLIASPELTEIFDKSILDSNLSPKLVVNWITGELMKNLNEENLEISQSKISLPDFIGILKLIDEEQCSQNDGKLIFSKLWNKESTLEDATEEILAEKYKFTDENMRIIVRDVLHDHPNQVGQYRAGKNKVFGFLMGQVMKKSEGKVDPKRTQEIMTEELGK